MAKKEIMIIADYSQEESLTIDEFCEVSHLSSTMLEDLIHYDIIRPVGNTPPEWVFDLQQLKRVQIALRLQHDLEVNLAGVAVVLDLLEQLDELQTKNSLFEKHLLKP